MITTSNTDETRIDTNTFDQCRGDSAIVSAGDLDRFIALDNVFRSPTSFSGPGPTEPFFVLNVSESTISGTVVID